VHDLRLSAIVHQLVCIKMHLSLIATERTSPEPDLQVCTPDLYEVLTIGNNVPCSPQHFYFLMHTHHGHANNGISPLGGTSNTVKTDSKQDCGLSHEALP